MRFFKRISLYDWYLIPTIHIYSRRKDTTIIEIWFLKFYFGWTNDRTFLID